MKYTISSGDTLSEIAVKFNTTVGEIQKINPTIKSVHSIKAGQIINLPPQVKAKEIKVVTRSMGTSPPTDYCARCQRKEIKFLVDLGEKNGELTFSANVNQKGAEVLPFSNVYDYGLKDDRYAGPVNLFADGTNHVIIPNLENFPPDDEGICRVFIGSTGQNGEQRRWKPSDVRVEDLDHPPSDEAAIILKSDGPPPDGSDGAHDIGSVGEGLLKWLIVQLLGSNLPPLFKDLAELGSTADKRAFLRDVFLGGKFVIRKIKDQYYVIFKGYAGLRTFLTAPKYTVANPKVTIIEMYANAATMTKGGLGSAARSAFKGNIISFAIVGVVDIGEFIYAVQKGEKKPGDWFSDLMVDLAMDFAKVMVAGYASLIAGALVVAGATALTLSAPVWLVVGGALAVGVLVGFALDILDEKLGATAALKDAARRAQQFIEDAHLPDAIARSAEQLRRVWSALSLPQAKIIQLRSYINQVPGMMIRSSAAVTPALIAAIMLDIMQQRTDLRVRIRKSLVDTEAKFIEIYEGDAETFEMWSLKTFEGRDIDELGLGLGHMNIRTVRDLVENNYLRREARWAQDDRDVAIGWLTDETRAPVLVGARLARISQFWYTESGGTVNISDQPSILASLYGVGLATSNGIHPNPQPNETGKRIEQLMHLTEALLNINR